MTRANLGQSGFSLLESIIAIALLAIILSLFTATTSTTVFMRRAGDAVQASLFVREELEALRALTFPELLNRTNGRLLGLTFQRGDWEVQAVTAPPSGTKALVLDAAVTALVNETGLAVLPGDYRGDFDMTAKIRVQAASPSGWGAGIAFRYVDAENHYRFRFSAGGIALDEVRQGTATTLWSQSTAHSTNVWYTLRVVATDDSFALYRNGSLLSTQIDGTITKGDLAIQALSGALLHADDVSVTESAVTTDWDFDADAEETLPADWRRLSYSDLPNGAATLTIADYLSQTTVKQVTVTVTWTDSGDTRTSTGTTLISQ